MVAPELPSPTLKAIPPRPERLRSAVTATLNILTGLIDGGFNAKSVFNCKDFSLAENDNVVAFIEHIQAADLDKAVYYGTETLRYFHPVSFNCYYSTTQSITAFN